MPEARVARMLAALGGEGTGGRAAMDHLSRVMARELEVSAVGFALVLGGHHRGTLGASDDRAAAIEDLQFTLGEGPCVETTRTGRPVFEPDLATSQRWPGFGPEVVALGVAAAFAVPLLIGAARFGSLDLYNDEPGPLDDGVIDDASVVADVTTNRVMGLQADIPVGSLSELFEDLAESRAIVHQATGVLAIQLDITLDEALIALRARAFADSRSVTEVSTDLVHGTLRFEHPGGPDGP